ncbi:GNAT family N-acetyltransferase [Alkalihalobacillus sp. FSL R5-0424]
MKLLSCTEKEALSLKISKQLTLSWRMSINPMKVELNGEIVALIDCSFGGIYGEDSLEIDNFEVFEKGRGIGSKIIKEILNEPGIQIISLYYCSPKSKKFWQAHGFKIVCEGEAERLVYQK